MRKQSADEWRRACREPIEWSDQGASYENTRTDRKSIEPNCGHALVEPRADSPPKHRKTPCCLAGRYRQSVHGPYPGRDARMHPIVHPSMPYTNEAEKEWSVVVDHRAAGNAS